ncbi:hypothetical protein P8452_75495 [Trifolium repens]|nr:hypothetical protein P8452_75495 [Trifolium repens]
MFATWLVRPVLETHGWDRDVGYEGLNVERLFVIKNKIPLSFSGQVTKDKKDVNVQMEMASSVKYGEGKATSLGFDMQTVGKDLAYTLRNEAKFCNFRRNKATAGHDDDVAYGGSLEAQLRDKNHPLGRSLSTLGISVMDWHGDLAVGCNLQSQIPIGRLDNDDAVRLCELQFLHTNSLCINGWFGAAALIAFLVSAVFHEISMALAGADSKELGFSCLVVEICIILTRNQMMRRNSQTTVTSSQQQWLDPSFQLNVPLVDVDKRMK